MKVRLGHIAAVVLAAAGAAAGAEAAPAGPGTWVRSADALLTGKLTFRAGEVGVGEKTVPWKDVLCLMGAGRITSSLSVCVVRFKSGDAWRVEIVKLAGGRLEIASAVLGKRQIDLDDVWAVEFAPGLPPLERPATATLYREKGECVPGAVLWMDEAQVAIDSPLGALKLNRAGLERYVFSQPPADEPGEADDVTLADGTVLRGQAKAVADGLELTHPKLGRLPVPPASLRSVLRRPAWAVHLAEARCVEARTFPLISRFSAPPQPRFLRGQGETGIYELHIQPKGLVRYKLARPGGVLKALLQPAEGARGAVAVRVVAGGKTLFEKELSPQAGTGGIAGGTPAVPPGTVELSVDLGGADELTVEVDFGRRILFPCGLTLIDPRVIYSGGAGR